MAWRISTAAGGVFVMNVNERSSKTVITTGIVVPMSLAVWALNAFTNSMMLMPCWPRAGPTGGAGEAWPPGACSLMVVRTFFAMKFAFACQRGRRSLGKLVSPARRVGFAARLRRRYLNLLHLIVADLDGRLPPEDRHQDLQLGRVLVDLRDLAGEVRQGAGDDLDRLADRE